MAETVYILGAGVNQCVEAWGGLKPPMAKNFFMVALQADRFANDGYARRIQPVYDFLLEHFKKSKDQLKQEAFDLEELFTTLESHRSDAIRDGDRERTVELTRIEFLLKSFFADYLSQFEDYAVSSAPMCELGRIIHDERAGVITFNYDCILEAVLEQASGVNPRIPPSVLTGGARPTREVSDDELAYSHYKWNMPLAYGFQFSEVELRQAGLPRYVAGDRFYSHPGNVLYEAPLLKLHGSLNWFRFLPISRFWMGPAPQELRDLAGSLPLVFSDTPPELPEKRRNAIVLVRGHWWQGQPPALDEWFIDPILVTPVLNKRRFLDQPVFARLWRRAVEELSSCKRLVVMGYSFPPTDIRTKDLLRRAFQKRPPAEVVVVDPDPTVVGTVLDLTHAKAASATFASVEEYVQSLPVTRPGNPTQPSAVFGPGERVTVAVGYLRVDGLELTGSVFGGATIVRRNDDGTYQVRGIVRIGDVDELTIPAEWIQPYEPPNSGP